jgi:L-ascorbate metabolism protein UlaG (beta-lactamase superfamily)
MNPKQAKHAATALDKSAFAATPNGVPLAPAPLSGTPLSRRRWLGLALGGGAAATTAEVASLGGVWDHRAPMLAPARAAASRSAPGAARLTHIGHCCHLIEMSGQRWLTDPWFFNPAFGSLTHASALGADAMGPLDGIFISHRHPDHFDPNALRRLDRKARIWTPDESLIGGLRELGFTAVSLSNPWQTLALGSVELSFVPAVHDVPEHSLMLAGPDARVLFCGDTGAHEHWAEIRRRYRPVTALLPCDGTALRWEPRQIMNPTEAARAAFELNCPQVLQTHADATYTDPVARYLLSSTEAASVARLDHALEQARGEPARAGAGAPRLSPLMIGETRPLAAAGSTTI